MRSKYCKRRGLVRHLASSMDLARPHAAAKELTSAGRERRSKSRVRTSFL